MIKNKITQRPAAFGLPCRAVFLIGPGEGDRRKTYMTWFIDEVNPLRSALWQNEGLKEIRPELQYSESISYTKFEIKRYKERMARPVHC